MKRKSWRDVLRIHPAAEVFPMMGEDELLELAKDIKVNTLQNPVSVWEQLTPEGPVTYLLDGRNRLDAMELARIPVLNEEGTSLQDHLVDATSSMSSFTAGAVVVALNVRRRHLNASQRAKMAAKALLADKEFLAGLKTKPQVTPTAQESADGKFTKGNTANKSIVAQVAEQAGVHRNTARKAIAEAKAEAEAEKKKAPAAKAPAKKRQPAKKKPAMPPSAVVAIGDFLVLLKRLHAKDLAEGSLKTLAVIEKEINRINNEIGEK